MTCCQTELCLVLFRRFVYLYRKLSNDTAPTIKRPSTESSSVLPKTNVGVAVMHSDWAYLASAPIPSEACPDMHLLEGVRIALHRHYRGTRRALVQ
jgi:hypothetical protein